MTRMLSFVAWLQLPVPLRQVSSQTEVVEVQYLIYRLWVQLRWLSLECVLDDFHETSLIWLEVGLTQELRYQYRL